jgi:OOP family OmpA-OmpF porin
VTVLYAALAALLIYLGSRGSPPGDLVVLLPDKNGKVGTVIVHGRKGETVLNSAYASARSNSDGGVRQDTASEQELIEVFGSALAAQPSRPISFLLYFENGSDELTEASKEEVKQLLAEMPGRRAPEITITGHTDLVGADELNIALSMQRAERVKTILTGINVSSERIQVSGRGKREPLVLTPDGVPEPRNRRVEVSVR